MAYQTMTASDLRATVRDITDLDAEDLPDSLLNLYLRDGYYRILDLEKRSRLLLIPLLSNGHIVLLTLLLTLLARLFLLLTKQVLV
jgi:hypothetical protein